MADRHIQQKIAATLIPGDGIGPDIVASTVDIRAALGSPFVRAAGRGIHPALATAIGAEIDRLTMEAAPLRKLRAAVFGVA